MHLKYEQKITKGGFFFTLVLSRFYTIISINKGINIYQYKDTTATVESRVCKK